MNIGIVAIGRNEGQRLRACLISARRDCPSVVYVDSGSVDDSVPLARSLGAHVVELDLAIPFTAARARNEGFRALLELDPTIQAVQFVDGDCEIVPGWIERATTEMNSNPRFAVVCGRRRERFPQTSLYNRLCDLEWNTPTGIALACGGDALIRVSAFQEAGGFNPAIIAGEEPEMCLRLRRMGWTIYRTDAEMTLHDAALTRFDQWWKRTIRSGHAYAEGFALHGAPPEEFRKKEVRSIIFWTLTPSFCAAIFTAGLALYRPRWWWLGTAPLLMYSALMVKIARQRLAKGDSAPDASLYAAAVVLGKLPQYLGLRKFRKNERSGRANAIIEYKAPLSRSKQVAVQGRYDVS